VFIHVDEERLILSAPRWTMKTLFGGCL